MQISKVFVCVAIGVAVSMEAANAGSPRVAVVACEGGSHWSQSSSQGVVGLAGLVGVPYDTRRLADLLADPGDYRSLWFSACPEVSDARYLALVDLIDDHLGGGGHVFLDGPLAVRSTSGGRDTAELDAILGVRYAGWRQVSGYEIVVRASGQVIAEEIGMQVGEPLSQGLHAGSDIVELLDPDDRDGAVLLGLHGLGDPDGYPYLIVRETTAGGRVVAVASYGSGAGAATSFRNGEPSGFFDNRALPFLLTALEWMEHGSGPVVGLQLSHAEMTAIGRIDGDWSRRIDDTGAAFDFASELARETGLATVYGLVSGFVEPESWPLCRAAALDLEARGGVVGSHSETHPFNMSDELTAPEWEIQIDESIATVRAGLDLGAPPVRAFINPGNTIHAGDYFRFFDDVDLFMSHGFETWVPYASGVIGFDPGVAATVVVNNTLVPDYQWFYSDSWIYSLDEVVNTQALILDYYQNTVGRGVLYNEMWHDYAISGNATPKHLDPDAPVRLLFDVNRAHFEQNLVYMPEVDELVGKFHVAARALRSSEWIGGGAIAVEIDYSRVAARYRRFAAGMGLRIRAGGIRAVWIDGEPHPGFSDDTVILPAPAGVSQQVVVDRSGEPDDTHLRFVNRSVDEIVRRDGVLSWSWSRPGRYTRSCVGGPPDTVVLGADALWRTSERSLCAEVGAESAARSLSAVSLGAVGAFALDRADRPIEKAAREGDTITLLLPDAAAGTLHIRASLLSTTWVNGVPRRGAGALPIPAGPAVVAVDLRWPERAGWPERDGWPGETTSASSGCRSAGGERGVPAVALVWLIAWLVRRQCRCLAASASSASSSKLIRWTRATSSAV